jgi:hypothetical protein
VTRTPQRLQDLADLARALAAEATTARAGRWGAAPAAPASMFREAARLVRAFLERWAVPVDEIVGIEHPMALDRDGRLVPWSHAYVRGKLDVVRIQRGPATSTVGIVHDWKTGWVAETEEQMLDGYAPGLYAAFVWAWAPHLDRVEVEYWYLRSGEARRTEITREHARETLAWAAVVGDAIAKELAAPEDPESFPARPSRACQRCEFATQCSAGTAALAPFGQVPITSESEARQAAGLLLAGESKLGALRDRLQAYCEDRDPLIIHDDVAIGWHPTMGEYDPQAVLDALRGRDDADPWAVLQVNRQALGRRFRNDPDLEGALAPFRAATPPWFGHKRLYKRR